jgi:DNA polymerase III subunit alpha
MEKFSHLHVHTQYSLLDGAASIKGLYAKAIKDGMPAVTISDHGNMFGVFDFVAEAYKHTNEDGSLKVKPIVGCEFYLTENRHRKQFSKEEKDPRHHQIFLAKNETGYKNLVKLCSLGYIEGLYSKYPRIDKELVLQYHEGLIATTCCLGAMVPQMILKKNEAAAEKEFKWWLDIFGEDYYVELQRHGMAEQEKVNQVLIQFAVKYKVKIIASNDSHYVEQDDFNAHDILLCINTGEKLATPALREFTDDDILVKNKRFAFPNDQFYFKTQDEMRQTFAGLEEAIENTREIVDKVELLNLKKNILLPHFTVPKEFTSQEDYLEHLTWIGAKKKYSEFTPELEERIRFELHTIKTMGFAGYFLIVQDFIKAGRELGVFVGPGRGSAAGSVVAYCTGITNIDPMKYKLLFERFLNPDRKSMPDIDTDFDDEGRQKVIDYVVEKYSKNQVAQIITYGTMAAKMSIKDVARVMDLPLPDSNALTKLVPDRPGIELKRILHAPFTGEKSLAEKEALGADDIDNIKKLREFYNGNQQQAVVLKEAERLEGSVRNTGIHAAGIIIAPYDLMDILPVCITKDSPLLVSQIQGSVIEEAGVLKMDFLGLKTLNIIKTGLELIKQHHGIEIDIDEIPLDDEKTFQLYQRGDTNGTFQFESTGMQKYLRELKPDKFDDLIAMNALYRPGPLAYIPNFIDRKHGREKISYDLPEMQEYLEETYGITVYQEQVMLLSQKLAGFTKGDADTLRKAMGKKQKSVLDKMKAQFITGTAKNNFPVEICEKIWTDWEAFAQYAFNKSHSTCYAFVAYQTAYLKAHYPSEYMSAVLNHAGAIEKITFFMEECRRMGIKVLGPDINESNNGFSVNAKGEIRFGMSGLKGVGEAAIINILEERTKGGPFKNVFDLVKRVNQRSVNKKSIESLICSGAFDNFKEMHRGQYFYVPPGETISGLDRILRFGNQVQTATTQTTNSLFGDLMMPEIATPKIATCEPWNLTEQLEREKEVTGMYMSGHPLDHYRFELKYYDMMPLNEFNEYKDSIGSKPNPGKHIRIAGLVVTAQHRIARNGNKYGSFVIEDYKGNTEIALFRDDYVKLGDYFKPGNLVCVAGTFTQNYEKTEYRFKVLNVYLIESVKQLLTRQVHIAMPASLLKTEMLEFFQKNLKKNPGNARLRFILSDNRNELKVNLFTLEKGITMNDELSEYIIENPDLEVSVLSG